MSSLSPAVFAVGDHYQIMSPADGPSLFSVRVGDRVFFDGCNGVMRSDTPVHSVDVPTQILDEAGSYTVIERALPVRKAYYPKPGDAVETTYPFYPVKKLPFRAFFISDAHGNSTTTVSCARSFGDIDLLFLGGDIADHADDADILLTSFRIADALTHGQKPVVYVRGNHALRGKMAEHLNTYIPTDGGLPYYTFRLGSLWGIALDCAEDKRDGCDEYGGTVCCHGFREKETEFVRRVVREKSYLAPGIETRVVIAHKPFTFIQEPPFDIEQDIYREWASLLGEQIRPDIFLSGHLHKTEYWEKGCENDHLGQPCPVVVGSVPGEDHHGTGLEFSEKEITVTFLDKDGHVIEQHRCAK